MTALECSGHSLHVAVGPFILNRQRRPYFFPMAPMSDSSRDSFFHTTRWSIVNAAAADLDATATKKSGDAFAELCRLYWKPLYSFIRRSGVSEHDAQDLTQAFFIRILEKPFVQVADPARGRFRTFLLSSLKNFLSNERDRKNALRRGGQRQRVSLDFSDAEKWLQGLPAEKSTPEREFERRWALDIMEQVLNGLRDDYEKSGKRELFEALRPHLTADSQRLPYRETAKELDMTAESVKVAVHRMRRKYRRLLEQVIGETVSSPDEVADEVRYLLVVLS